jgi:7,8-dihydroneopterin aldolase/epimerase/oxygenase
MGKIVLENMEFYAFHGCYEAEQIVGNKFLATLEIEADLTKAAETDQLKDALNYQKAYEVVKEEMKKRSNLLEHLAQRILNALYMSFPEIQKATIKVTKLYPPIGGQMKGVTVEMNK